MFWGLVVEQHKKYTQKVEQAFHISQATIDVLKTADTGNIRLLLEYGGVTYVLATLSKEHKIYQVPLDLNFNVGDQISFRTIGNGVVHLTGYHIDADTMLINGEDESDLEEESLFAKFPLEEKKGKKHKISDSSDSSSNKKKKLSKKSSNKGEKSDETINIDQESDDDEYEDDDDDDDEDDGDDEEDDDMGDEEEMYEDDDDDDDIDDDECDEEDDDDDVEEEEEEEDEDLKQKNDAEKGKKKGRQLSNGMSPEPKKGEDGKKKQKKNILSSEKETPSQKNGVKSPKSEMKTPHKENKMKNDNKTPKTSEKKSPQSEKKGGGQNQKGQESPLQKKVLQGGIIVEELKNGNGQPAKPGKMVQVYYVGRLQSNKKQFDEATQGPGFKFRLGKGEVIKGLDIGLAGLKVGGKRRLTIPPQLAYGAKGAPPAIPPNSTLIFEVELKAVH